MLRERPRSAMPGTIRSRAVPELERAAELFTDAAELFELDRARAARGPIGVEHSHEAEQIAQRSQRDGAVLIGHPQGLASAAPGGKRRRISLCRPSFSRPGER